MTETFFITQTFSNISKAINARFSQELWLDFEVLSLRDETLKIRASTDFCDFHECEIVFSGVLYYSGPMVWGSDPPNGLSEILPENYVLDLIEGYRLATPCCAIAINTDTAHKKTIIAASSIQVNFDKVYYYEKENLGLNERIGKRLKVDCDNPD